MTNAGKSKRKISPQLVGAFGERAVEGELLRNGWMTSNLNRSVPNAADFDIFARKDGRDISVRVKASGPGINAFQFGFRRNQDIVPADIGADDFTILVNMGESRSRDQFYIIPTRKLRKQIKAHRDAYLAQPRRDGKPRKDLGMWTLHLNDLKRGGGRESPNRGYARKWTGYLEAWESLEK